MNNQQLYQKSVIAFIMDSECDVIKMSFLRKLLVNRIKLEKLLLCSNFFFYLVLKHCLKCNLNILERLEDIEERYVGNQ